VAVDIKPNTLREKLANGHRAVGTAVFSWSPNVIDVAASAGLDYVRIDTEHAFRRDDMLEQLVRAANLGNIVPIVRIDKGDPYLVRKVLEIGAGGIIVPNICSPTEAQAVVRSAKFPPDGDRGYSSNCRSADWGANSGEEWVLWSNREPMIGIMIESVAAMPSIDDILAVDGVDFVLFGPADYSMSLGLGAPMPRDARVQSAIEETVRAAHEAGKFVSLGVGTDQANIKKHLNLGIDMLELGNDLGIIRGAWADAKSIAESGT
jgi:4-hydroxy-2-oxoheptanedioate aldolase